MSVTLGIGVTHAMLSEGLYGIPYSSVVDLRREELLALGGLLGPEHRTNHVSSRLLELAQSGVTELMADVFGSVDEREATVALLTALPAGG